MKRLSKEERLRRIHKNLTRKQQDDGLYEQFDRELSWSIWIVEKEFHVGGIIDNDFPAMKLFNLCEKVHIERYDAMHKTGTNSTKSLTMG